MFESEISNSGRLTLPKAVRDALGVQAGGRIRYVIRDGEVRIVKERSIGRLYGVLQHDGPAVYSSRHGTRHFRWGEWGGSTVDAIYQSIIAGCSNGAAQVTMLALDEMDSAEIGRYLEAQGVLDAETAVTVAPLGGGVSNIVLMVRTPSQCLVLKQALPELRVAAYWPSRIDRALREAEALRIVADHLPSGAVPKVYFIDAENYIYGMSCAPASATLWKEDLLAGEVEVPVAAAAGRILAQMHAIQDPTVQQRFSEDEVFWQLRVDPYYNTIAEKYPSVKPVVARAIAQMKARKLALVHGDYSPKNIFVCVRESGFPRRPLFGARFVWDTKVAQRRWIPAFAGMTEGGAPGKTRAVSSTGRALRGSGEEHESTVNGIEAAALGAGCKPALREETTSLRSDEGNLSRSVLLLDFEVVHWGDPAFDLAFCINHLLIKSIVNSHVQQEYFRAVTALMNGYRDEQPGANWGELQAETRLQLGCLMLARIDGKSPVEYITDEPTKEIVRRVSLFVLHEQSSTMEDIYTYIAGETVH